MTKTNDGITVTGFDAFLLSSGLWTKLTEAQVKVLRVLWDAKDDVSGFSTKGLALKAGITAGVARHNAKGLKKLGWAEDVCWRANTQEWRFVSEDDRTSRAANEANRARKTALADAIVEGLRGLGFDVCKNGGSIVIDADEAKRMFCDVEQGGPAAFEVNEDADAA